MNKEVKHTPTPWEVEYGHIQAHSNIRYWQITDGQDAICNNQFCFASDSDANAAHIVKCVNMHDELVGALRLLLSSSYDYQTGVAEAYETLKKAGAL